MSDPFATHWTVACQVPLSVRFPRQEEWSGFLFPSPGNLQDPGTEPLSVVLTDREAQNLYYSKYREQG